VQVTLRVFIELDTVFHGIQCLNYEREKPQYGLDAATTPITSDIRGGQGGTIEGSAQIRVPSWEATGHSI